MRSGDSGFEWSCSGQGLVTSAGHPGPVPASWALLCFPDGEADVYGLDDLASGFMVNHASGLGVWSVLVEVARRGELAILPVWCPAAVTSQDVLHQLPSELVGDAVILATGAGLLASISSS